MTIVVFTDASGLVGVNGEFFGAPNIIQFVTDAAEITHTPTEVTYVLDDGVSQLIVGGTFTAFDVDGNPTAGTITSFTLKISQTAGFPVTLAASGFELSVSSVYGWIQAADDVALQTALFGGTDAVTGTAGNDQLYGHGGGLGPRDVLSGGAGDDTIYGDRPSVFFLPAGAAGADTIHGGDGNDTLFGDGSHDILNGEAGDDTIDGGEGDDHIHGGAGNDLMDGGAGSDFFEFDRKSGQDTITGFGAGDRIDLAAFGVGDLETLAPYLRQTAGGVLFETTWDGVAESIFLPNVTLAELTADRFRFNADTAGQLRGFFDNADVLFGGSGDDTIDGRGGNDEINGGAGHDLMSGGAGDDLIRGGKGNDQLQGGGGADQLYGGAGIDTYTSEGVAGGITVHLTGGWAQDSGGTIDTLFDLENVVGTAFADTLVGNTAANALSGGGGNDWIVGLAGDDVLEAGAGTNVLFGGDGVDTVSYAWRGAAAVWVNLAAGIHSTTGIWDVLDGVEGVRGTAGADSIFGNDQNNILIGGEGADSLIGGDGRDRLEGGAGADWLVGGAGGDRLIGGEGVDVLTGGDGADVFELGSAAGWDVAFDFNPVEDRFLMDGSWLGFLTIDADGDGQEDDTLLGYAGGNFVALNVSGLTLEEWNRLMDRSASADDGAIPLSEEPVEPLAMAPSPAHDFDRESFAHAGARELISDLTGQSSVWALFG